MLAAMIMAAAASVTLGVWPEEVGPPVTVVEDVEFYTIDPEDDYWIIAVQALAPALGLDDREALSRVAGTALRLGADAAILLGELPAAAIPDDVDAPLEPTGRYAAVAFVGFFDPPAEEGGPSLQAGWGVGSTVVFGDEDEDEDQDEDEDEDGGGCHGCLVAWYIPVLTGWVERAAG